MGPLNRYHSLPPPPPTAQGAVPATDPVQSEAGFLLHGAAMDTCELVYVELHA